MQREAIEKTHGPCIILAGAGTGKTHTIVEKLKHLIQNKIYSPEKIVCLTFSNEAANEMRRRIIPLLEENEKEPTISTFHSFCAELIRKHGGKIGIKKDFKILLPDDAKILLHKNLKVQAGKCHSYIQEIGIAKDIGITIETIETYLQNNYIPNIENELENLKFTLQTSFFTNKQDKEDKKDLKEKIKKLESIVELKKLLSVWKSYEKLKNLKGLLDYSDLNQKALQLVDKNQEIKGEFDYFIVDEFQDTNKLQCDLLEKLSNKNITIVGDLNQSIYRFRGAYKHNFDNFKKNFQVKSNEIFTLDKSHRSTNRILKTAHELILNNYENKEDCFLTLNAKNKEGCNIQVYELESNKEEVRKIHELIQSEISKNTPLEEICVMFRTHQQSRMLKTYLDFHKIPYVSVTKSSLLKIPEIKITKDYLTIIHKIKNKVKGGEHVWWDLFHNSNFNREDSIILSRFIKENREKDNLSQTIIENIQSLPLSQDGKIKLSIILSRINNLLIFADKPTPELILKIYENAGFDIKNDEEKMLILDKFHFIAKEFSESEFSDLSSFIHHLEIINALGIEIEAPEMNKKGVRIMTNHSTKGLEYKAVVISNLAQKRFPMEKVYGGIIPSELSPEIAEKIDKIDQKDKEKVIKEYEEQNQLLEERRLCYVAFTRAKENLYLTYAKKYGEREALPSQFLNEINYKKNPVISFIIDQDKKYISPEINEEKTVKSALDLEKNKAPQNFSFSPSSLQLFTECQKRYEYRYVYNMPDQEPIAWDALKLGSFVHKVFEEGVKSRYKTEKQFIDYAKSLQLSEEWNFIEVKEAMPLIRVFFHRNKDKYNEKSLTEVSLPIKIEDIKFFGKADRIDFNSKGEIEIIDYKTGSTEINARYRNWQLGYYALAVKQLGIGNPIKITLDLLKKEKPIEFIINKEGEVKDSISGRFMFTLEEVKKELADIARQIIKCYETNFKTCPEEKNCDFCNEFIRNYQK